MDIVQNTFFTDFVQSKNLSYQSFLPLEPETLLDQSTNYKDLTVTMAKFLKDIDLHDSLFGIEIQVPAGSRSIRIPLIRLSKDSLSIWKIVKGIKGIEKGVQVLNDINYYIKKDNRGNLPRKVLVVIEERSIINEYLSHIQNASQNNQITIITSDYLVNLKNIDSLDLQTDSSNLFI